MSGEGFLRNLSASWFLTATNAGHTAAGQVDGQSRAYLICQAPRTADFRIAGGAKVGEALAGTIVARRNESDARRDGWAAIYRDQAVFSIDDQHARSRTAAYGVDQRGLHALAYVDHEPVSWLYGGAGAVQREVSSFAR